MGINASHEEEESSEVYHITDTFVNPSEWKRIVKQYNSTNSIEDTKEQVDMHYFNGSPPYTIYAIKDPALKEAIQDRCHEQPHLILCHTILIFCAHKRIILSTEILIDSVFQRPTFRKMMHQLWGSQTSPDRIAWTIRQSHVALGFAMVACHEQHISFSPIDITQPDSIRSLLDLPDDMIPTVLLAIGAPD